MKPQETIDFHIKTTWLNLSRMYNQIAAEYGMSLTIAHVLLNVRKDGTPATKIAPAMGMEPTSLSRLLKNMEERKFIYRASDKKDKRVVRIFLTDEGYLKKKVAGMVIQSFNERVKQVVDTEDFNTFMNVIQQINTLAESYKLEQANK